MQPFEIGVVLPLAQFGPERTTVRWVDIRLMTEVAEAMGFDTVDARRAAVAPRR